MRKIALLGLVLFSACQTGTIKKPYDWQGHRGARGEAPENTIPAMLLALQEGVMTLEMDVVISSDSQVVVSHEPFFNPDICLSPEGENLDSPLINLYQLSYEEIRKYDCGSLSNPRFTSQENYPAQKPRLIDLISEAEEACLMLGRPSPFYNVEIKSRPDWDEIFHPSYKDYVDLVLATVDKANLGERLILQSFDPRVLQYLNEIRPEIKLAYLMESTELSLKQQFEKLGFVPDVYSPYYEMVDRQILIDLEALKVQIVPWTVNEIEEAKRLKELGVDGIITDYPGRMISTIGD